MNTYGAPFLHECWTGRSPQLRPITVRGGLHISLPPQSTRTRSHTHTHTQGVLCGQNPAFPHHMLPLGEPMMTRRPSLLMASSLRVYFPCNSKRSRRASKNGRRIRHVRAEQKYRGREKSKCDVTTCVDRRSRCRSERWGDGDWSCRFCVCVVCWYHA